MPDDMQQQGEAPGQDAGAQAPDPGQGGAGPPSSSLPSGLPDGMLGGLEAEHKTAKAQYQKTAGAVSTLERIRSELEQLKALGDQVGPEDVIEAGGGLIAAGLGPTEVAGLLASMPSGGQAISGWLADKESQLAQQEQQIKLQAGIQRHQMGLTAMHLLMAHDAHGRLQAKSQAGAPPNPLMAGGGAPSPAAAALSGNPLMPGAASNA